MTLCIHFDEVAPHFPLPTVKRRLVSGTQLMFAKIDLEKGTEVPSHHHMEEQLTYVLQGKLEIQWGEEKRVQILGEGDLILYGCHEPHGVKVLENTVVFEAFSPPIAAYLPLAAQNP